MYCVRAMDYLLQFDDALAMRSAFEGGDGEDGMDGTNVGGSIAGSRVSRSGSNAPSGRGGGSRASGGSRSMISATTASVASEARDVVAPSLGINHFDQLIQGALLLSRCATRSDEKEDCLLLAHQYVLRIFSKSFDTVEHDITTRLFADLPEFTEAGDPQPPYDEWAQQYWRDNVKPHAAPLSDRAWIHYWPDEAVLEGFQQVPGTLMDMKKWNDPSTAILHLETLAMELTSNGYHLHALPVYALWWILSNKILNPSIPSLCTHVKSLRIRSLRALNMNVAANTTSKQFFGTSNDAMAVLTPTKEELDTYEEEVVQREQMQGHTGEEVVVQNNNNSNNSNNSNNNQNEEKSDTPIFARPLERLHVHSVWISIARGLVERGRVGPARTLLVEAERHARAFQDVHASADIRELHTSIALLEGDDEAAGVSLNTGK